VDFQAPVLQTRSLAFTKLKREKRYSAFRAIIIFSILLSVSYFIQVLFRYLDFWASVTLRESMLVSAAVSRRVSVVAKL